MANLIDDACTALQQAINLALQHQQPAGHWVAPVSADVSFTAEYVMFKYAMEGLSLDDDGDDLRRWILATQTEDGSWTLAPDLSGNVSSSVEAYLALRLLNVPATDPAMQRARSFILSQGGIAHVRFFTRFFLASFGLIPWTAVPQMPLEVILLPTWAPLNIYVLSHWARSTLMPLLLIRHHEPVYPLPNGYSTNNDFLDELWCDPTDKMVPYTPPLLELFWGKKRHVLKLVFTLVDKLLAKLSGIRKTFLNRLAKQRCLDWILEHQEEHGDWAGYFPPIHGNVWVLLLEGYSLDSRRVRLGLEALERFSSYDENGKWFQPTVSPCWDTALMANALCDAGLSETKSLVRAADWLWDRQLMVDHGDWRIYANTQQAGGWSFEYFNTFFPDVDDTAVVIMTLVKQDPGCIESRRIINAVEWILGMQNQNGGWGAFDINNEAVWLHAVPFNDTDALVDPATADVTGRILECWALLLAHRRAGYQFPEPLRDRLRASAQKAIPFLLAKQERSGAWWGRWGCNYIYGTANVLRGLQGFCTADTNVQKAIAGGVRWLRSAQQSDGGWGETLFSYTDATLAGCGITTAAQTAWAVDCILRFGAVSDPVVERGIGWLVKNQQSRGKDDGFASWPTNQYVGTGFPKVMFVGYPFYHHHFPIAALSRYIHRSRAQTSTSVEHLQLSSSVVREILSPSVLVMALGGRDHLDSLCRAARQLKHCRVRFATHPEYRKVIESQGFEFFDVSSSPDSPGPSLHMDAYRWRKYAIEQPAKLIDMICLALTKLWYASIDFQRMREPQVVEAKTESLRSIASRRIFVADVILSGSAATVNVYAAEQLQAVLLMVLPGRELIPTSGSHTDRTIRLQLVLQRFRDYTSQVCLDILHWMAFGKFLGDREVSNTSQRPLSTFQTLCQLFLGHYRKLGTSMAMRVSVNTDTVNIATEATAVISAAIRASQPCSIIPLLRASWSHKATSMPLSGAAAAGLVSCGALEWEDLDLEPRAKWSGKSRRQARASIDIFVQVLGDVIRRMLLMLPTVLSLLCWLLNSPDDRSEKIGYGDRPESAMRQARMYQAKTDLDIIRRNLSKQETDILESRLSQYDGATILAAYPT